MLGTIEILIIKLTLGKGLDLGQIKIEIGYSIFRLHSSLQKGAGSRNAGLVMSFKLITMAERRWRKINAPHLVSRIQAGAMFPDCKIRILPDFPSDPVVNLPMDSTQELVIHNI